MRFPHGVRLLMAVVFFWSASPLAAQTGTLTGTVRDAETDQPLPDVAVELRGGDETQAGGIFTDGQGRFRFSLQPGRYSVVFSHLGYESQREDGVQVRAGQATTVEVDLVSRAFLLNPMVISVSKTQEKALEAPAHVDVVGSELIQERVAVTPVEHVKALPGVDVAQTGISQTNVVTRGFNNVFSGALLIMVDNRYTHVPSLRFNANNMIPTTDLDIDRIEVSLGPGAALYGPNSASGVMHIITKSPLDDPGGGAFISSGFRSGNNVDEDRGGVFQTGFRYSSKFTEKTGVKVSGQYMRANDWEFIDPLEQAALDEVGGSHPYIGNRDFMSERYGGELRLDHRFDEDTEFIASAGHNVLASSIELTGLGAGQADDWGYSYAQARFRKGRLFSQVFMNWSDAGDTYLLQTGQPIVDKSRMMAFQLQHALDVGDRQSFIYGLDLQRTEPKTEGTITGSNEDDDIIDEIGGYLHSETDLTDKLDLVAALRIDHHNRLQDLVFSPRAALVLTPQENQNFRLTFNRAFSTPTTNNLFLDIVALSNVGGLPYDIRTFGVPETGLTFDDRCQGTHCMYSPFAPGAQLSAGGPGPVWNVLLQQASQLNPALGPLVPYLQADAPDIATYYRRFNQEAAAEGQNPFLSDEGPGAIQRLEPTITNSFELGYKGLLGDRLLLAADVYHSRINDFVGPLRTETPSVFMSPESLQAFLVQNLTPLVQAGVLSPTQMQATVTELTSNLAQVPIGTVAPDQRKDSGSPSDLILTYRNFGDVDFWGADLAAQVFLSDRFSLRGAASWVSEECFDFNDDGSCSSALDVALNAPSRKGNVSARWHDAGTGVTLEGRVRYSDSFPMNSGVYIGDVDSYTVFDANLAYRVPALAGATLSLTANNVFNNLHREFIGAPELGRLLMLRLQYGF